MGASLWRYYGHIQLGEDARADPEHYRGILYHIWPENALGSPRSWSQELVKWVSGLLYLACYHHDMDPDKSQKMAGGTDG